MKNVFKLSAFASLFALSITTASASEKIGFVDPIYLLQNHPSMIEASQKLEQYLQEVRKKFEPEQKQLEAEEISLSNEYKKFEEDAKKLYQEQETLEVSLRKKMEALNKEAPRLRSKDIEARQNAIQSEQKAFQNKVNALNKKEAELRERAETLQAKMNEFQQKLEKEQNGFDTTEVQKLAVDDVNKAIKVVADEKGYTIILPTSSALYAKNDDSATLTENVLSVIKSKSTTSQAK